MSTKKLIWISVFVCSIIGGYIPVLFGSSLFSFASFMGNSIGALIGIWVGFKINSAINGEIM